jgi:hypothetical protein
MIGVMRSLTAVTIAPNAAPMTADQIGRSWR